MSSVEVPFTIIGGGVLGLWMAKTLRYAGIKEDILLLEKSLFLGDETTGRNSGVLHSGIYYPKNSNKHLLCLRGNKLWQEYCKSDSTLLLKTGKYIIASKSEEMNSLEDIFNHGQECEVPDLRRCSKKEILELSDNIQIVGGIFSPSAGILNVPNLVKKLETECLNSGVLIFKNSHVRDIKSSLRNSSLELEVDQYGENIKIESKNVFNLAGHGGIDLRRKLGLQDIESYLVKGSYLKTSQKFPFSSLVYPIPPKNLKGLGIHITFDFEGNFRFGPNTLEVEKVQYDIPSDTKQKMLPAIQELFKKVEAEKLSEDYCGIRPKIKKEGKLHFDFSLSGPKQLQIPGYFEACGIESPGLTAAPAICEKLLQFLVSQ